MGATRSGDAANAEPLTVHDNRVSITGRVSSAALSRTMPSGDEMVTWRVVVDRPPSKGPGPAFDVVDCVAWGARVRRGVLGWSIGDVVAVEGALPAGSGGHQPACSPAARSRSAPPGGSRPRPGRSSVGEGPHEQSGGRLRDEQRRLARHPVTRRRHGRNVGDRGRVQQQGDAAVTARGAQGRVDVVVELHDVLVVLETPQSADQIAMRDGDVQRTPGGRAIGRQGGIEA